MGDRTVCRPALQTGACSHGVDTTSPPA